MMKYYKYYPLIILLVAPLLMASHIGGHPSYMPGNAIMIGFVSGFMLRLAIRLAR
jgi:hypothetical protein